ncbi:MAG: S8 family serine peptidase [Deinococcales bacterium]
MLLGLGACSDSLAQMQLEYGAQPLDILGSSNTLTIRNIGLEDSILNWNATTSATWLTISPSQGSLIAGQSTTVTFTPKSNVPEGNYQGEVSFNAEFLASQIVQVKVTLSGCITNPENALSSLSQTTLVANDLHQDAIADYVPGQLLIRYHDSALSSQSLENLADSYGLKKLRSGQGLLPDLFEIDQSTLKTTAFGADMEALAQEIAKNPQVLYAHPNYYLYPQAVNPNDSLYAQQWNLKDFGLPEAWAQLDLNAQAQQKAVVLAVLDSGFDLAHPDLVSRFVKGCDFYGSGPTSLGDNDPNGPDQHGSHVAGIAAALSDNGVGVAGVAYKANIKLLPLKIFDESGLSTTVEKAANAMLWAAGLAVEGFNANSNPAQVINFSVGSPQDEIPALNEAIAKATQAGALVFVASGNAQGAATGDMILSPANAPDAIAVGSVDSDLGRSSFSRYSSSGETVDLMAPGGSRTSGRPNACNSSGNSLYQIVSTVPNNAYGCLSGTSMASPYAAGVAALIWSHHRNWNNSQVKQRLLNSLYKEASWSSAEYGGGIICADKALGASTTCGR